MRKLLVLAISALLVAGSLVATLGAIDLRDYELRGYVDATQVQNIPFIEARPGVNVEMLQYDETELRRQLGLISQAGFRWIRQFAYWDQIEAAPGEFHWTGWDRLIAALEEYPRLKLVAVLMNSPQWARATRGQESLTRSAPPGDVAAFGAFAGAFASRYGALVDYYQIWDEPNLSGMPGETSEPRPAEYVALLAAARVKRFS